MKQVEFRTHTTGLRIEKRNRQTDKGELKGKNVLVGYAAVFNQRTHVGYWKEMIVPGAFSKSIQEGNDIRALVDHNPASIIARSKDGGTSGTLRLSEDDIGLRVEIDVADTQVGRDILESVTRGDVDGMSFGFFVRYDGEEWVEERDEQYLRVLRDLDVFEVSVVTFPAYEQTAVATKAGERQAPMQYEVRSLKDVFDSRPKDIKKAPTKPDVSEITLESLQGEVFELRKIVSDKCELLREIKRLEELTSVETALKQIRAGKGSLTAIMPHTQTLPKDSPNEDNKDEIKPETALSDEQKREMTRELLEFRKSEF